jgi:diguanylate cyclase (GGDEF)-like protein
MGSRPVHLFPVPSVRPRPAVAAVPPATVPPASVILDGIGDAVIATDTSARITYMNPAAERLTGFTTGEVAGSPLTRILRPEGRRASPTSRVVCRDGAERPTEVTSTPLHGLGGAVIGRVLVCRDVGPALALTQALNHRATHDSLTTLPNRRGLFERLEAALAAASAAGHPAAVGFLDVDGMKAVNDTHGHATGDELLVSVADRLRALVRGADTVSRLGGDEFVVVLSRVERARDAEALLRVLGAAVALPHRLSSAVVRVDVSAGLACYPDHGHTAAELLARADRAMYVAKQARSGVAVATA